jgi:hypothetical protein
MHFANTKFGFEWGAAKITRLFDDHKKGWVTIGIQTPKHKNDIQVYVTKSGKVRIFDQDRGEWFPMLGGKAKMSRK